LTFCAFNLVVVCAQDRGDLKVQVARVIDVQKIPTNQRFSRPEILHFLEASWGGKCLESIHRTKGAQQT